MLAQKINTLKFSTSSKSYASNKLFNFSFALFVSCFAINASIAGDYEEEEVEAGAETLAETGAEVGAVDKEPEQEPEQEQKIVIDMSKKGKKSVKVPSQNKSPVTNSSTNVDQLSPSLSPEEDSSQYVVAPPKTKAAVIMAIATHVIAGVLFSIISVSIDRRCCKEQSS